MKTSRHKHIETSRNATKCDNGHFQYKIVHFGIPNPWGLKPYFAQAELPHQHREENKGDHLKLDKICKREKIF